MQPKSFTIEPNKGDRPVSIKDFVLPKGTKMQISFKKVKPAAKGKAKAPVKKKMYRTNPRPRRAASKSKKGPRANQDADRASTRQSPAAAKEVGAVRPKLPGQEPRAPSRRGKNERGRGIKTGASTMPCGPSAKNWSSSPRSWREEARSAQEGAVRVRRPRAYRSRRAELHSSVSRRQRKIVPNSAPQK